MKKELEARLCRLCRLCLGSAVNTADYVGKGGARSAYATRAAGGRYVFALLLRPHCAPSEAISETVRIVASGRTFW